ncbi:class I SAM-dependent DNA methyltransferase [Chloroflexota bacterium]
MVCNEISMYDIEAHIAEIYDRQEDYTDDVDLIKKLIGETKPLNILEPFCGTGRILIPLAQDGHRIVGLDRAEVMLQKAREKIKGLPAEVQNRVKLHNMDVIAGDWPIYFDLVILGGNCLYELATSEEQENCIKWAASSLKSGGYVYIDNNHMEGELDPAWQQPGVKDAFPTGICADGTFLRSERQTVWFDVEKRLVRYIRRTKIAFPDGEKLEKEYPVQCHPPAKVEVQDWLESHGFIVEQLFGDRAGNPYTEESDRAIFWAVKR